MKLLKPGFSHCFTVSVTNGQYVKYEHGHGITSVECFNDLGELLKDCIMIKCQGSQAQSLFYINSCVGFVKAVTGIKSKAITPYQLYKYLKGV